MSEDGIPFFTNIIEQWKPIERLPSYEPNPHMALIEYNPQCNLIISS